MKDKVIKIMLGWIEHNEPIETTADKLLDLFAVSGSFSQKDMENFAAKCMILGNDGKTTKELLQDFCDNDR